MRMVFARTYRYGAKSRDPRSISELTGESFIVGIEGDDGTFWRNLESGAGVTTSEFMFIPYTGGGAGVGLNASQRRELVSLLRGGRLAVTPSGVVYADLGGRGDEVGSRRMPILGFLRKRRVVRPLLGFMDEFNRIWPRHARKYDRVVESALAAADAETTRRDDAVPGAGLGAGSGAGSGTRAVTDAASVRAAKRAERLMKRWGFSREEADGSLGRFLSRAGGGGGGKGRREMTAEVMRRLGMRKGVAA